MSSPACTELEVEMMNWLGQMLHLPPQFLANSSNGKGGGVIQVKSVIIVTANFITAFVGRYKI
jgi:hypothetical protein